MKTSGALGTALVSLAALAANPAFSQTGEEVLPDAEPTGTATLAQTQAACRQMAADWAKAGRMSTTAATDTVTCEPLRENGKISGHVATYMFNVARVGFRAVLMPLGMACGRAQEAFDQTYGADSAACEPVMDKADRQTGMRAVFRATPQAR